MIGMLSYVRNLLNSFGWNEGEPASAAATRTSFKRDRNDDQLSDDESPTLKKLKQLRKTSFPDVMETKDLWEEDKEKNVRYIPIQVESGHPSTSTPNEGISKLNSRVRSVPVKLVDITSNGPSSPPCKPRMHTPVRPVIQAVIDDEDDEQEVTWIESKPESKKPSKVYIDLSEEEDNENEVIFVKKISTPPPIKPYKFFVSKNKEAAQSTDNDGVKYYKICRQSNDRSSNSLKPQSNLKSTGISKLYRKSPTPVARWMLQQKNLSQKRSPNCVSRTTLSELFNLDEKKNYQELIKRVADTTKPVNKLDIYSFAKDAAEFRSTQKSQKSALNELKFVERGISVSKENESTKEYDPITVASINSSDSEVEIIPSETSTSSSLRIDPINSLRDLHKDRAITSTDWLSKLNKKYKKKDLDNKEKIKDARRESDIISKIVFEQKVAHLEHKLKYEFSIPESLIEEAQPAVELPPLTPEQEKLVNRALGPGPPSQVLVEKFNLRILKRDLQTLSGLNWLNDEVINFYMNLLMQRSQEKNDLPKVYATNTFFYPKLMQSGQVGLRRWTRKVDIFSHDIIVVPVHLGVHWCLSLIDFRRKKISYLDSMGGSNQACLNALLQYLRDEHKDKKGEPFNDEGWTTQSLKDIPQQMNGSDCGMFACTFAEFSCRDAPYTFTQANMPYLRRKAVLEILQAKLLL